ncbi:MAG: hypothetical protein WDM84_10175 [Bauldia sp.]
MSASILATLPPTRYRSLGRVRAIAILVVTAVAMLALVWIAAGHDGPAVPAAASADSGDLAAYGRIVDRMRHGEGYYTAAHTELLAGAFGTRSVFNWRLPALPWAESRLPSLVWSEALLGLLAVAAALLAFRHIDRTAGRATASVALVALASTSRPAPRPAPRSLPTSSRASSSSPVGLVLWREAARARLRHGARGSLRAGAGGALRARLHLHGPARATPRRAVGVARRARRLRRLFRVALYDGAGAAHAGRCRLPGRLGAIRRPALRAFHGGLQRHRGGPAALGDGDPAAALPARPCRAARQRALARRASRSPPTSFFSSSWASRSTPTGAPSTRPSRCSASPSCRRRCAI